MCAFFYYFLNIITFVIWFQRTKGEWGARIWVRPIMKFFHNFFFHLERENINENWIALTRDCRTLLSNIQIGKSPLGSILIVVPSLTFHSHVDFHDSECRQRFFFIFLCLFLFEIACNKSKGVIYKGKIICIRKLTPIFVSTYLCVVSILFESDVICNNSSI